jgi:hypothetical protein
MDELETDVNSLASLSEGDSGWTSSRIWRWANSDYVKLVPILVLAFYIGFIPHQSYAYPVHLDEWNNYTYSQVIYSAHSISFTDPWQGGSIQQYPNPEVGYNVFWSVLHMVTGIPLLTIFRFGPAAIMAITALAVYILGRREGFGWEASLFLCLIPTTVGILGPAFMVPVALGLLFIPLSLFIVFNYRTWWSYLLLYVFIMFLLAIHAPTAVGLCIILVPYALINLKGDFLHSLAMLAAMVFPFLFGFPWVESILRIETQGLTSPSELTQNVALPHIMGTYGYLPVALGAMGIAILVFKGKKSSYGLILGTLALLILLVARFTFHYGADVMYFRSLHYMMLMMSVLAGAGLWLVRKIRLPEWINVPYKLSFITRNIGNIVSLVLIGMVLYTAIPQRQHTPYYHMINEQEYQSFVWIRENVDASYQKAILDPWKATAFTGITGKYVLTKIGEAPTGKDVEVIDYLNGGCKDTSYLIDNGVSLVFSPVKVENDDLIEVHPEVYLLKPPEAP